MVNSHLPTQFRKLFIHKYDWRILFSIVFMLFYSFDNYMTMLPCIYIIGIIVKAVNLRLKYRSSLDLTK